MIPAFAVLLLTAIGLGPVVAQGVSFPRTLQSAAVSKGSSALDPSLRQLVARLGPGVQQAPAVSLGVPAAKMTRDSEGRVGVRITAADPDRLVADLRALGMTVTANLPDHHLLEGFIAANQLPALDALAAKGLFGVLPMSPKKRSVGLVTSQADFTQGVERVRGTLPPGLTGAGVRVGVMSDSFNRLGGAAAGVASGDLPVVSVLQELNNGGIDEGRAMAELVHDLAPGSPITFGSVFFGEAAFAQMIQRLANPAQGNCKTLVDDVFYLSEPIYQDGVIAQAVDSVVTNRGVTYFSSAGNQADQACEFLNLQVGDNKYLDFNPGVPVDNIQRIVIPANGTAEIGLHWDDPFYTTNGVDTDLDLELFGYDAGNNLILIAAGNADSIANKTPWEFLEFTNPFSSPLIVELAIKRYAGANPGRVRWENFGHTVNMVEYSERKSGTISPHSAAVNAMSVAAVNYFGQESSASFTSVGPATVLFTPSGAPLGSPQVRSKPDFAAIQGTDTTFFGSDAEGNGFPNFFGTSASAPHAAAIAALIKEQFPSMTPADIYARMKDSTGNSSWNNVVGFGTVRAYEAIFGPAAPASVALSEGFESNTLSGAYEVGSTGAGRVQVNGTLFPASGARHLVLDSSRNGTESRNSVILHLNAAALSNVTLSFKEKEFSDDDHPMSAAFTNEFSDGVALSVDGVQWYRLVSLTGAASTGAYQNHTFNLSQVALNNGLTLGANTRILFQQYGTSAAGLDGIAFDDLSVTADGVTSSLTLLTPNGGETWNVGTTQLITWTSTGVSGNVRLEFSANGGTTWTPILTDTPNDGTESWILPNVPTTQGRVRVSAVSNPSINSQSSPDFSVLYVGGVLKAPAKAKFGTVKIGKTKTKSVVLQNTSKTAALNVNVSISGAPFRIVSGGGATTIAPKKKLTVKVICEPTAAAADGSLLVTSSDPSKPSVSVLLDATIR